MWKILIILTCFLGFMDVCGQQNYIQINGSTNVNNFKCRNDSFNTQNAPYFFSSGKLPNIKIKVDDFDCENKMMTNDLKKTLFSQKYPYLNIKFLSFTKEQNFYKANVEVTMMFTSKVYNIILQSEKGMLIGKKEVKFSDFKIERPKKMGGMIQAKDELNLIFALSAK